MAQEGAVALLLTEAEIVRAFFHGFDYRRFGSSSPTEGLALIVETLYTTCRDVVYNG